MLWRPSDRLDRAVLMREGWEGCGLPSVSLLAAELDPLRGFIWLKTFFIDMLAVAVAVCDQASQPNREGQKSGGGVSGRSDFEEAGADQPRRRTLQGSDARCKQKLEARRQRLARPLLSLLMLMALNLLRLTSPGLSKLCSRLSLLPTGVV